MKEPRLHVRLMDRRSPDGRSPHFLSGWWMKEPPLPVRLVDEGAPTPCQAGGQNHQPRAQSPDLQELTSLGCGFTVCLGITRFVGIGSYSGLSSWDTETRAGET